MRYIALISLLVLTGSCKKDVQSSDLKDDVPYYQYYELAYNESADSLRAMASFKIRESSGANIELTGNSSVKLNGFTPTTSKSDKTVFHWSMAGTPDANFILTKSSGQQVLNSVRKNELGTISFDAVPAKASRAAGFKFTWKGSAIAAGEEIQVDLVAADKYVTSMQVTKMKWSYRLLLSRIARQEGRG